MFLGTLFLQADSVLYLHLIKQSLGVPTGSAFASFWTPCLGVRFGNYWPRVITLPASWVPVLITLKTRKLTEVRVRMIWKSHSFSVWNMLVNKTTWGTHTNTKIPHRTAGIANQRNAGAAEAVEIDRWQMVSLFQTQRTSTAPTAKMCKATEEEKQPLWLDSQTCCVLTCRTWARYTCNTNCVSSYVLANWWDKETKKKQHTRLYPSRL